MDWNHRLDVQEVNRVIVLGARGEVEVILERHTDQVSHRVLSLLHQLFITGLACAGLLRLRSLRRQRCAQQNNHQWREKFASFYSKHLVSYYNNEDEQGSVEKKVSSEE